ncbi:hypothetical protein BDZ89DRAFT_1141776 [Hymenopellis radicata]|nr:hypothetical protein BDZ89DRAFT_1141776 [Hymenopellis radicata]
MAWVNGTPGLPSAWPARPPHAARHINATFPRCVVRFSVGFSIIEFPGTGSMAGEATSSDLNLTKSFSAAVLMLDTRSTRRPRQGQVVRGHYREMMQRSIMHVPIFPEILPGRRGHITPPQHQVFGEGVLTMQFPGPRSLAGEATLAALSLTQCLLKSVSPITHCCPRQVDVLPRFSRKFCLAGEATRAALIHAASVREGFADGALMSAR